MATDEDCLGRDEEKRFVLFADESGNVGMNYLDESQPFHVAAGWLVPPDVLERFDQTMNSEFGCAASGERKGSQLVRRPRGQQRLVKVLSRLRGFATPFFIIYGRRFALAAKVQAVFFDAAHNPAASWIVPGDASYEKLIAERLYRAIPPEVLDAFAGRYRTPSRSGLEASAREMQTALVRAQEDQLADTMRGAVECIDEIAAQEDYSGTGNLPHAAWASLNVPTVVQLVRKVDEYMDQHGPATFEIVHDQTEQFQDAIARSVDLIGKNHSARDIDLSFGRRRRLTLGHYRGIRMADSADTPGVRAADLLASTVGYLLRQIRAANPLGGDLRKLCRLTLLELAGYDPPLAGIYIDQKTLDEMATRIYSSTGV